MTVVADERVIWHDDQVLAHVEIGFGAHVAVNPGTLRIEEVLQLAADAFANDKADNCPICAIDEHVVDDAEQSSALRDHLVTDDVRHAWQVIEFRRFRQAVRHAQRQNQPRARRHVAQ